MAGHNLDDSAKNFFKHRFSPANTCKELVFPPQEWQRRMTEVRNQLRLARLDALFVTLPENIFYLTGYQTQGNFTFHCVVIPADEQKEPFMITRLLESTNVNADSWISKNHVYRDTDNLDSFIRQTMLTEGFNGKTVGYDRNHIAQIATPRTLTLQDIFVPADLELKQGFGLIEEVRLRKSDLEIEYITKAGQATAAAITTGVGIIQAGARNENEIAAAMQAELILQGSEWPGLAPFVTTGWRASCGHTTYRRRTAEDGEFVFLEIAGCYNRYHAPMMRMMYLGELDQLGNKERSMVEEAERVVTNAVNTALELMKPGAVIEDVDAATRSVTSQNSFGALQQTRSAYSVGIGFGPDWGEGHVLSFKPGETRRLEENMVFHLIPWIQVPGVAGIGMSETVQVTPEGGKTLVPVERKIFSLKH